MTQKEALIRVVSMANKWIYGEGAEQELSIPKDSEAIEIVEKLINERR